MTKTTAKVIIGTFISLLVLFISFFGGWKGILIFIGIVAIITFMFLVFDAIEVLSK